MTFETALPPEIRHFDPRPGWWGCGHCNALFQAPLYDENGDFYQDEATGVGYLNAHSEVCNATTPYLDDPNGYYPDMNNPTDPEPKCYFEACNY